MRSSWSLDNYSLGNATLAGVYFFYTCIIIIGSVMNFFVLYHMKRLRRRDKEQFRNGIGICLFVMAITGLVTLFTLAFSFFFSISATFLNPISRKILCKIIYFISHAAYSQSMWVWLIMSTLRYIATRKPLQYTTLYRLPCIAMTATMIGSVVENSYLLFVVEGSAFGCILENTLVTRVYKIFDVFMSFAIPTLLVLYMDISVLCCRMSSAKSSDPMLQIVINRPNGEKKKLVHRFIIITVLCLTLNFPENSLRFLGAVGVDFLKPEHLPLPLIVGSQAMYFLQFAFNAFYLTTFVYEKSVMSKTNSSRQLSISFRHRLEENSHLIRERASTISYRSASPSPGAMARNASCCALDRLVPQKHWL